jgi:hypothetical protein
VREREDFMIRHENLLEAPIRAVRPEAKSARLSVSPGPDSSLEEPTPPSSSRTQDAAAPAKEEVERSFEMKSNGQPILGPEVSEWVFAKIVDIEIIGRQGRPRENQTDRTSGAIASEVSRVLAGVSRPFGLKPLPLHEDSRRGLCFFTLNNIK